jgi:hypothetical protein
LRSHFSNRRKVHVEQQLKLHQTTLSGPTMDTFTAALKHENEVNQGWQDCQEDALSQAVAMARALKDDANAGTC